MRRDRRNGENGPRRTPRAETDDHAKVMPRPTIPREPGAAPVDEDRAKILEGHIPYSHPSQIRARRRAERTSAPTDYARNVFLGSILVLTSFGAGIATGLHFSGDRGKPNDPNAFVKDDEIEGWKIRCSGTKIVEIVTGDTYESLTSKFTTILPQAADLPVLPSDIAESMNADRNDDDPNEIKAGEAKELFTECTTNFDQPPTTTSPTTSTTGN